MVGPSKWVHGVWILFTCCRKCIVNAALTLAVIGLFSAPAGQGAAGVLPQRIALRWAHPRDMVGWTALAAGQPSHTLTLSLPLMLIYVPLSLFLFFFWFRFWFWLWFLILFCFFFDRVTIRFVKVFVFWLNWMRRRQKAIFTAKEFLCFNLSCRPSSSFFSVPSKAEQMKAYMFYVNVFI